MGRGAGRRRRGGQASATQSPARGAPTQEASNESSAATAAAAAAAVAAAAVQRSRRSEEFESFLDRVRKQVEFYFSDANLRRDVFLQRKMKEGDGYVELATLLTFNRIRTLRCFSVGHLAQAVRKSDMLVLSEDKTKLARNREKAPVDEADPTPRIVYVEGLPITFSIDDLNTFFSRYGRVCLVELPRQRQTREPRGFCFVEYSTSSEADYAVAQLDNFWPSTWPTRYDAKALRAMPKASWYSYKREFQVTERSSRRGIYQRRENASESMSASAAPASSSTTPAPGLANGSAATSVPASSSASPKVRRGCLLRISGFSQPQTQLSLRQFVEHAVPVEFCDFEPGDSQALLRLRSPEDCNFLLMDLRQTSRYLGWLRPQVSVLTPDEEERYWQEVASRYAARADISRENDPDGEVGVARLQTSKIRQQMFPNPEGVVVGGPTKTTTVYRFPAKPDLLRPKRAGSTPVVGTAGCSNSRSGSFVDTAGGCSTFGQAGLGKPRIIRRRIFGTRAARLRKDVPLRTVVPPMPRRLKNVVIAPPSPPVRGHSTASIKEPELGPPAAKVIRQAPQDPLFPPPSPGPLQKPSKLQKVATAPVRQGLPDMQFPPPSPVAVPQPPAKRKRAASPVPQQPVRKPFTGLVPLLLPPPSPIAKRPDRVASAPSADAGEVVGAAGATLPDSGSGPSTEQRQSPKEPELEKQDKEQKDSFREDSMLDKIDIDELESLFE